MAVGPSVRDRPWKHPCSKELLRTYIELFQDNYRVLRHSTQNYPAILQVSKVKPIPIPEPNELL